MLGQFNEQNEAQERCARVKRWLGFIKDSCAENYSSICEKFHTEQSRIITQQSAQSNQRLPMFGCGTIEQIETSWSTSCNFFNTGSRLFNTVTGSKMVLSMCEAVVQTAGPAPARQDMRS